MAYQAEAIEWSWTMFPPRSLSGIGRERKGKRVGKGEGGLDLDICPGGPKFLVTPLFLVSCAKV